MKPSNHINPFQQLQEEILGEVFTDQTTRILYATDASAYKVMPLAVVYPKNEEDIQKLIEFAMQENLSLIPRAAGTSLAGQVVGNGVVVDISKHLTKILELNVEEKWVRVQPGVILDELNLYLKEFGLFFGPETSTSGRCMLGGMLGNNSCGSHSIIYGSTRDHTLEVKAILSDGSKAVFGNLNQEEFKQKCSASNLEGQLYQHINSILSLKENQENIRNEYPDPDIKRRNTGYAIDLLLETNPFTKEGKDFNFSDLLAGSEGTLAFTTEIKLNLVPAPPKEKALICAHFESLEEAIKGNLIALKYKPGAVELMDDQILKLTEGNILQAKNRFFLKGNPGALLIIDFARESMSEIEAIAKEMEKDFKANSLGYHFPIVTGVENITRVWDLRKSALGVLSNMAGDAKPVSLIEDTSVKPEVLYDYIAEFKELMKKHNISCVFHAHIGSGEIHLRPVLNLKAKADQEKFHAIGLDSAKLVKKYKGSLSGEHGDGRLRGEFIPIMIGEKNYELLREIKHIWDPNNIFNPGKIVDTPKMNTHLRYEANQQTREIDTYFDFSSDLGIVRATERCNGSGDCRNTHLTGKALCPSYQASLDEKLSTRARANLFREFISNTEQKNPFNSEELYDILDFCLSCKACKSECPSNVDMAKLKAEFLQQYYDVNPIPLRSKLIANITKINQWGSYAPSLFNFVNQHPFIGKIVKRNLGFAQERSIPKLHDTTLKKWHSNLNQNESKKRVYLFADEFTDYNDTPIGIKTVELLNKLGYEVSIPKHAESGRTYLSKGLVKKAKFLAIKNVNLLQDIISEESPLIGIEPSAILTFRDEYIDLVTDSMRDAARNLAKNVLMIEEFLHKEMQAGTIKKEQFSSEVREIKFHAHCYQKSLASSLPVKEILSFPENYSAVEIKSGCCGMAGSFGYEEEHYDLSKKVGELILLPEVRKTPESVLIAASGTSCRHQIKDETEREAQHPVEILWEALK
ncbi:FAD-binding and (Fe-S)-binding domain-containing protein [Marinifilum caeruleilacunae]|uniref:FAD-binding oxidoreductase n=1 Tax=Marinifilum caeruleilacunae TaxID=2499076 RepID=A0ABX1WZ51_9BACT|nr:FAD-binding and (Fe-S)-binding domain-containing protein [Marinifilum caeruleilacunae]NOU61405.1 FAD-binding oxidoreductase [Marinifilum caeruleilacunae]